MLDEKRDMNTFKTKDIMNTVDVKLHRFPH